MQNCDFSDQELIGIVEKDHSHKPFKSADQDRIKVVYFNDDSKML